MIIAFAPTTDKAGINPRTGKPWKDATHAFIPEAKAFVKYHNRETKAKLVMVDNSKRDADAMRSAVFAAISREEETVEGLAFMCHGLKDRIQFGIHVRDINALVLSIPPYREESVRVTFYACDAARDADAERSDDLSEFGGDGGFADKVRDSLCANGLTDCVVDAHTSAAHTTMNPNVRRFEGMGSNVGGAGGYYIVPQGNKLWKPWVKALKTEFRFEFPYLSTNEIHEYLAK